jgi:hypothetical protein
VGAVSEIIPPRAKKADRDRNGNFLNSRAENKPARKPSYRDRPRLVERNGCLFLGG